MDIQTCIKYLDFVSQECERYLRDGRVSDEELINLIIEMKRFKEKSENSNLPTELKSKISDLKLDYTVQRVERGSWYILAAFASFGAWSVLIHFRQQSKRKQTLSEISFDASRLSSFIRFNY
ncbi:MAG: hypothetical protein COA32_17490 [Fluviicola sp.]|nr:MAG: hypothetical protein COA32_17490 [Fluviicola sp.]